MNGNEKSDLQRIFERPNAQTALIASRNTFSSDGIQRWGTPQPCRAIELEHSSHNTGDSLQEAIILLLEGEQPALFPGDLITWQGRDYEISSVKYCRDFTGRTVARRCTSK